MLDFIPRNLRVPITVALGSLMLAGAGYVGGAKHGLEDPGVWPFVFSGLLILGSVFVTIPILALYLRWEEMEEAADKWEKRYEEAREKYFEGERDKIKMSRRLKELEDQIRIASGDTELNEAHLGAALIEELETNKRERFN